MDVKDKLVSNESLKELHEYNKKSYSERKHNHNLSEFGITASVSDVNNCSGVKSNIQTQLNDLSNNIQSIKNDYTKNTDFNNFKTTTTNSINSLSTPTTKSDSVTLTSEITTLSGVKLYDFNNGLVHVRFKVTLKSEWKAGESRVLGYISSTYAPINATPCSVSIDTATSSPTQNTAHIMLYPYEDGKDYSRQFKGVACGTIPNNTSLYISCTYVIK